MTHTLRELWSMAQGRLYQDRVRVAQQAALVGAGLAGSEVDIDEFLATGVVGDAPSERGLALSPELRAAVRAQEEYIAVHGTILKPGDN